MGHQAGTGWDIKQDWEENEVGTGRRSRHQTSPGLGHQGGP